ncbi:hypothetical protein HPB50_000225 [Hyalomma asiaticum]|uniref:Uncharacterized protein n=1 Tax=Hyalomma asiaticum TaxID=266040 RepID=A0ACB7RRP7_HYAAI|nr:hypothetical protein HPB50_000225 [Hyalomma asiaticum]
MANELSEHAEKTDHKINWDKARVVATEKNLTTKLRLSSCALGGPTTKQPPGCTNESFEKCGTDLILFAGGPVIPTNKEQLLTSCPKEKASEKCARSYSTKCLARFPRGMVMLLLDGIRNEVNAKCNTSSPSGQEYLKHATCLNTNGAKLHQCMRDLTLILDQSVDAPQKSRLALSCCSFNTYRTCMTESVNGACDSSTKAYVDKLITGYAGDLLDTVVRQLQDRVRCLQDAAAIAKVDQDGEIYVTAVPAGTNRDQLERMNRSLSTCGDAMS